MDAPVRALDVPMTLAEAVRLGFMGNLLNQVSVGSVGGDLFKAIEALGVARKNGLRLSLLFWSIAAIGLLGLLLITAIVLQTSSCEAELWMPFAGEQTGLAATGLVGLTLIVTWVGGFPLNHFCDYLG